LAARTEIFFIYFSLLGFLIAHHSSKNVTQTAKPHGAQTAVRKSKIVPWRERDKQAVEKHKFLSFRGTLRAEESLILLTLGPREIPHFVRNDKIAYFFRSL
jgi:hypothetical protein